MNHRPTSKEIIIFILVTIAIIILVFVLALWTNELKRRDRIAELRFALEEVMEEEGERGLLELVGVPVRDIHYSYEDVPLYTGRRGSWHMSEEDRRGVALYNMASPSVVKVSSSSMGGGSSEDGSGVIISSDGYIVTNNHVIGRGTVFHVTLFDGRETDARLIGRDSVADLAVVKISLPNLTPVTIGASDSVAIGENVYAIGHPYGFGWSFSRGIVSGLNRVVRGNDSISMIPGMIQTDALINPGNSGGPLLSADGKMIGIVNSIYTESGSGTGVGFAIPVETVMDVAGKLIANGHVSRGFLDLVSVELNSIIADYASLPITQGLLISEVVPGGEAEKAGLKGGTLLTQYGQSVIYIGGDIITAINGEPVRNYNDYFMLLFPTVAGEKVDVTVFRGGREIVIRDVVLVEQNEENLRWIAR